MWIANSTLGQDIITNPNFRIHIVDSNANYVGRVTGGFWSPVFTMMGNPISNTTLATQSTMAITIIQSSNYNSQVETILATSHPSLTPPSSSDSSSSSSSPESLLTSVGAGILVGILVPLVVALCLGLLWLRWQGRKNRYQAEARSEDLVQRQIAYSEVTSVPMTRRDDPPRYVKDPNDDCWDGSDDLRDERIPFSTEGNTLERNPDRLRG
jgi:hypothetical protein